MLSGLTLLLPRTSCLSCAAVLTGVGLRALIAWDTCGGGQWLTRRWRIADPAGGVMLGLSQPLRGAHCMNHTVWTGCTGWTWARGLSCLPARKPHAPVAG